MLNKEFIDNLPKTDEKIIDEYMRTISKEIAIEAKEFGIDKARQNANTKYGKFWRERLKIKKIYKNLKWLGGKMSYF